MSSAVPVTQPCQRCGADSDSAESHELVAALREIVDALREVRGQAMPDPLRLLRAEQVAELLGLPVRTVRDQASAGVIPHRRFGKHYRFSREDVEAIVQQMAREPRTRRTPFRAA
jgi:excisionase family DNA binding protein